MRGVLFFLVFFPFAAGIVTCMVGALAGRRVREISAFCAVFAELALSLLLFLFRTSLHLSNVMTQGLLFCSDGFRSVYAVVTAFMWFMTTLFSFEYFQKEQEHQNRYWLFVLWTLGATEGVMLSGDFMTAFVFFEILSFTSFTWVVHEETQQAIRAGCTYLYIAVIGGLILFMGLLLLKHSTGTLIFSDLPEAAALAAHGGNGRELFAAGICILLGFGAKAGMFPLHIWLPKAHPVAPSPASALLSGILTKVGIYGILMLSVDVMAPAAAEGGIALSMFGAVSSGIGSSFGLLVVLAGTVTMVLGAVLGLFSVNVKRTLACSSMSQIGFILTGIGMTVMLRSAGYAEEAGVALSGTVLHMVNHSLIKLCLFMAAGVFVMKVGALDLDALRGYGRKKIWLKIAFLLGLLGISGVPLFNGYISKTLLHEGIVGGIESLAGAASLLHVVEWLFLISGGLTFAYMSKLFVCIFIEKNTDSKRQKMYDSDRRCMNKMSTFAVCGSSVFMVLLGIPAVMKNLAAYMTGGGEIYSFRAFSAENLRGAVISLGIGILVYFVIVRKGMVRGKSYVDLWPSWLDLEEILYRPVLLVILPDLFGGIASIFGENMILRPLCCALFRIAGIVVRFLSELPDGIIVLLRRSLFKEQRPHMVREDGASLWWSVVDGTRKSAGRLSRSFSYAMLLACIGILLVFGVLVVMLIVR